MLNYLQDLKNRIRPSHNMNTVYSLASQKQRGSIHIDTCKVMFQSPSPNYNMSLNPNNQCQAKYRPNCTACGQIVEVAIHMPLFFGVPFHLIDHQQCGMAIRIRSLLIEWLPNTKSYIIVLHCLHDFVGHGLGQGPHLMKLPNMREERCFLRDFSPTSGGELK